MQFLHLSAYTTRKKGRKRAISQKPFKHIKIYLTCDLTTKYQVIPPINGRETKEKRKKQTENVQFVPLCTTPERLYHAQKRSKPCNFPKPFKHIKIYLVCDLTTKYQVIPPINGREIKKTSFFFYLKLRAERSERGASFFFLREAISYRTYKDMRVY